MMKKLCLRWIILFDLYSVLAYLDGTIQYYKTQRYCLLMEEVCKAPYDDEFDCKCLPQYHCSSHSPAQPGHCEITELGIVWHQPELMYNIEETDFSSRSHSRIPTKSLKTSAKFGLKPEVEILNTVKNSVISPKTPESSRVLISEKSISSTSVENIVEPPRISMEPVKSSGRKQAGGMQRLPSKTEMTQNQSLSSNVVSHAGKPAVNHCSYFGLVALLTTRQYLDNIFSN